MTDIKYSFHIDYFKIGSFGDKHVKRLNIALFVSGVIIILTTIFYLIMLSFTNFGALDDLQEYATAFSQSQGDDKELSGVNLALKVMPSYNFKKNAIWMTKTREVEDTIIPNAIGVMESLDLNNTYMKIENTDKFFPKFKYTHDNIPVGNSISLCIALFWNTIEKGENFDLTDVVKGFPACKAAVSGKFIWNTEDTTEGVDVPAWTQSVTDIDCTDDEDCQSTCDGYNSDYIVY